MINREEVRLVIFENTSIINNTAVEPMIDAVIFIVLETAMLNPVVRNMVVSETPKLAPEEIPKTEGPAKGFWNKACSSSPETPNANPENNAVSAWGIRLFTIIWYTISFWLLEFENNTDKESVIGIETDPVKISVMNKTTDIKVKTKNIPVFLFI